MWTWCILSVILALLFTGESKPTCSSPKPIFNWPINNNLRDVAGTNSHLSGCAQFTYNRELRQDSAISFVEEDQLAARYLTAPANVYFTGDFTITAWVKLNMITRWATLMDFANGQESDNVYVSLTNESMPVLYVYLDDNNGTFIEATSSSQILEGVWTHIGVTLSARSLSLYLNGRLDSVWEICASCIPRNVMRRSNFVGWSNYEKDAFWYSLKLLDFSDLRIYDKPLNATEMTQNFNG